MTLITASTGGFYLHTFLSFGSPLVVFFQQFNWVISMLITGLDLVSTISVHTERKRNRRTQNSALPRQRSSSSLIRGSQYPQAGSLAPHNGPDNQSAILRASGEDDRSENIIASLEDVAPVEVDFTRANDPTTTQSLKKFAEHMLEANEFQSTFGATSVANEADVAIEEETPDDAETLLARQKSEATQHGASLDDIDDDQPDDPVHVYIVGVKRTCDHCGVKWWYLMQRDSMTVQSDNQGHGEFETPYGKATINFALSNGYQFVKFSPKWVRCRKVPEYCKVKFWSEIGHKFWRITILKAPHGDVCWLAGENLYTDLTDAVSMHLCTVEECETCQKIFSEIGSQ